jgi:hypothetical protein
MYGTVRTMASACMKGIEGSKGKIIGCLEIQEQNDFNRCPDAETNDIVRLCKQINLLSFCIIGFELEMYRYP